jgi:hypothetical protein
MAVAVRETGSIDHTPCRHPQRVTGLASAGADAVRAFDELGFAQIIVGAVEVDAAHDARALRPNHERRTGRGGSTTPEV